jgi:hypothetical protein
MIGSVVMQGYARHHSLKDMDYDWLSNEITKKEKAVGGMLQININRVARSSLEFNSIKS